MSNREIATLALRAADKSKFETTPPGDKGKREPQTILKTDERDIAWDLGARGN
jgi:hypothetical protein